MTVNLATPPSRWDTSPINSAPLREQGRTPQGVWQSVKYLMIWVWRTLIASYRKHGFAVGVGPLPYLIQPRGGCAPMP